MCTDDREKEIEIQRTKDCATCELRELNYKRAYLRLVNRVCEAIKPKSQTYSKKRCSKPKTYA